MPLWCIRLSRWSLTVIFYNRAGQNCFCKMILSWVYTLWKKCFSVRHPQTAGPKTCWTFKCSVEWWTDWRGTRLPVSALSSCHCSCYRIFISSFGSDSNKSVGLETPVPLDTSGKHFIYAASSISNFSTFLRIFLTVTVYPGLSFVKVEGEDIDEMQNWICTHLIFDFTASEIHVLTNGE